MKKKGKEIEKRDKNERMDLMDTQGHIGIEG
jgi:hypothetical protein